SVSGLADATLTQTSGQTDADGTTATTFQAGATPGSATVAATSTGLSAMVSVTVSAPAARQFYVANVVGGADFTGSITVYSAGANTGLTNPQEVALDAAGAVYVVNAFVNRILIFAAGATGDVPPTDSIVGPNTHLDFPQGIAFDAAGNLYVGNLGTLSASITVYAAGARGNA